MIEYSKYQLPMRQTNEYGLMCPPQNRSITLSESCHIKRGEWVRGRTFVSHGTAPVVTHRAASRVYRQPTNMAYDHKPYHEAISARMYETV